MSYRTQRARRDRKIRQEVNAIALHTSHMAWAEFCQAINAKPWWSRARYAWHTLMGSLRFEKA